MKNTKKGFTLVELLVVIAILAILATVAIVGYTSFIEKAEKSVDYQVAEQLNEVLKANEVLEGKPEYLSDVFDILREAGFAIPGALNATYEKHTFVWDSENNTILVVENNKVVYPEDYEGNDAEELLKNSNLAIPTAKLTENLDGLEVNKSNITFATGQSMVTGDLYNLDAVYTFEVASVPEEYMDYYVDFIITVHDDLENVAIAGNYGDYGWIAVEAPSVEAGLEVPLLDSYHGRMTYRDIVSQVGVFHCAISNLGGDNAGKNVTVKLCLWADEKDVGVVEKAIVVNVIEYTFD